MRVVFPQRRQKAFQAHRIMGIIDHQRKIIGDFDHLNPSFDFRLLQRLNDIIFRNIEMAADSDRRQRIVNTELSRYVDFDRKLHKAFHLICDTQISGFRDEMCIGCPKVRILGKTQMSPAYRYDL